ncbi:MAG: hypothetical protein MUQ30_00460, partial [Anaerolineae bacterium]|nr:hypothetical protein [Anaerolineae bacterium]
SPPQYRVCESLNLMIAATVDLRIVIRDELAPGQRYEVGEAWIIFLFAQKHIVQGIATTGLKG